MPCKRVPSVTRSEVLAIAIGLHLHGSALLLLNSNTISRLCRRSAYKFNTNLLIVGGNIVGALIQHWKSEEPLAMHVMVAQAYGKRLIAEAVDNELFSDLSNCDLS